MGLSSSLVGRFFRGERENGQPITLRGVSEGSSGGLCGGSSGCPGVGVGREKMRWKEDGRRECIFSEKTAVLSTSGCGEVEALAMSRDSLTRWLNSFTERVSFLAMEDGGR